MGKIYLVFVLVLGIFGIPFFYQNCSQVSSKNKVEETSQSQNQTEIVLQDLSRNLDILEYIYSNGESSPELQYSYSYKINFTQNLFTIVIVNKGNQVTDILPQEKTIVLTLDQIEKVLQLIQDLQTHECQANSNSSGANEQFNFYLGSTTEYAYRLYPTESLCRLNSTVVSLYNTQGYEDLLSFLKSL